MQESRRLMLNFVTEHDGRICSPMCPLIGRDIRESDTIMCDAFGRIRRDETSNMPLRAHACFKAEAALHDALDVMRAKASVTP